MFATSFLVGVSAHPDWMVRFKLWQAPSISDYSSFGRFPITIELITGGGANRKWRGGGGGRRLTKSARNIPRARAADRESPRRLRNVAARKCVMYFIIVNIGDVRCVWISTIFTMSPRLRLISAGSPINRISGSISRRSIKGFADTIIFRAPISSA